MCVKPGSGYRDSGSAADLAVSGINSGNGIRRSGACRGLGGVKTRYTLLQALAETAAKSSTAALAVAVGVSPTQRPVVENARTAFWQRLCQSTASTGAAHALLHAQW